MGLIAQTLSPVLRNLASVSNVAPLSISQWQNGRAQLPNNSYQTFAFEGYSRNELVYAAIEMLSTSAAEPRMHCRLGANWTLTHPILELMRRPNPFMDAFEFWATVIMYLMIAGNAYALKVRSRASRVVELWLLRPDRVQVVPDREKYIGSYEFLTGAGVFPLDVNDVIHWKLRNPLNDFYGMPPLMPAGARVDVDNYMRDFIKAWFVNAGVPSGVLSMKSKVTDSMRQELKARFHRDYSGPLGWHEILVLDNTEANFTSLTQGMGQNGLVVPSLDELSEARISMVFGVPLTLIGARLGVNSSSYANKRSDRESFWQETLAPMYKMMSGRLNLRLISDFPGVDEIGFDLSDVTALQPDIDQLHDRTRKDVNGGLISVEEGRRVIGWPDRAKPGEIFYVPANLIPTASHVIDTIAADISRIKETAPTTAPEEPGDEAAGSETIPPPEVPKAIPPPGGKS